VSPARRARAHLVASITCHGCLTTGVISASEKEETFSATGDVERLVRPALEHTPPHTILLSFPRTSGPNPSPHSPPLPLFHSLPLSCEDATMLLVRLVQKTEKASRGEAFSLRDPSVNILFVPR
jgi:hypothetical protein